MHATLAIIGDVTVTWPDAVISSAIMVIICSLRTKPTDVTLTSLSQMSKAILEYYNVIIRQEDLDTLKNDAWIADTIVEFHEEYLERTVLHNFKAIKLLRPSMVYLVANIQDASELASALPPDLSSCQAVFIPVNDAADPTCPDSGSHWSLLVYARPFNSFFYYDSLGDSNLNAALAVAQKFAPLLSKVRPNFVHENDCPQQSNGADCGACVIGATDVLVNRLLQPQTPGTAFSPEAIMHLNEADVLPPATIRKTLQKVIMKFVKVANSTPGNAIRAGDSVPISTA